MKVMFQSPPTRNGLQMQGPGPWIHWSFIGALNLLALTNPIPIFIRGAVKRMPNCTDGDQAAFSFLVQQCLLIAVSGINFLHPFSLFHLQKYIAAFHNADWSRHHVTILTYTNPQNDGKVMPQYLR